MIKLVIISILSFVLGLFAKDILERINIKKKPKKIKPLSKMTKTEFKKAMKDLEIK